jgi:hypoxanthine phosphoribosyltransferase
MKKHFVSWQEIERLTDNIAGQIKSENFSPDVLLAISRGGLVPAVLLSHRLGTKIIATINVQFYQSVGKHSDSPTIVFPFSAQDYRGKSVLVVDDIADTGQTLKLVCESLNEASYVAVAVLHLKSNSGFVPDYYGDVASLWIVYPWEC